MSPIKFYGSQVGGKVVTPYSYTDSPLKLLRHDVWSALKLFTLSPYIVVPISPFGSGEHCELYPSAANLWNMFLHTVLLLMQIPFIISVPFWVFFPVWSVIIGVSAFWAINQTICFLLNGSELQFHSDPKYVKIKDQHKHEQWIFLNGVAVGRHWLQSNINRLALTFGRDVLGVHNKTNVPNDPHDLSILTPLRNGILFDILQCLIQRNFNYATNDIRDCYKVVKETLYNPGFNKVVFILHSQGGIEGGMIIDWLLQELPQDLLAKLEVYTFGNAANHFNNPHLHLLSQHAALSHPTAISTTKTKIQVHYHDPLNTANGAVQAPAQPNTTKSCRQSSSSGKTIRYIEHYAHTSDFVARWGVLHFVSNFSLAPTAPRYLGRVFERPGKGHQFNQHYLDSMFPLNKSFKNAGIGGSGFEGCSDVSEFMDSAIELGGNHDEREGLEMSYHGANSEPLNGEEDTTVIHDMSPVSPGSTLNALRGHFTNGRGFTNGDLNEEKKVAFKVGHLSRLWLYRNGGSPKLDEIDVGITRMATI